MVFFVLFWSFFFGAFKDAPVVSGFGRPMGRPWWQFREPKAEPRATAAAGDGRRPTPKSKKQKRTLQDSPEDARDAE